MRISLENIMTDDGYNIIVTIFGEDGQKQTFRSHTYIELRNLPSKLTAHNLYSFGQSLVYLGGMIKKTVETDSLFKS